MRTFVGIDLGNTHACIATFDGRSVQVRKSIGGALGQSETTPSAIFMDENQSIFVGVDACKQIPYRPEDVAVAWRRLLGTGAPVEFEAAGLTKSPEWCSTEFLKKVYGYLPLQIRQDPQTSVVVTVPAAFGQLKNDATLKAAEAAGIPNAKLMPEPVAACLAVMHKDRSDKTFLVYDLGGGTFDASVAAFKKGSGSIIAQGGFESSGGRDLDFEIVNRVIIPWICDNYEITPEDLNNPKIKDFLAQKAEEAKIELSARYEQDRLDDVQVTIVLPEGNIRIDRNPLTDSTGKKIGLIVPLNKTKMDQLVENHIKDTIASCRHVLADNKVDAKDIDYIVFIGEPTLFTPLREKVCAELGIEEYPQFIDPMTAVAKGAAIYAESLDWSKGGEGPGRQSSPSQDRNGTVYEDWTLHRYVEE